MKGDARHHSTHTVLYIGAALLLIRESKVVITHTVGSFSLGRLCMKSTC
jgi:hypothetical protein